MQFEEKLDVIEEDIVQYSQELLNILLKDRTTKRILSGQPVTISRMGELYANDRANLRKPDHWRSF